MTMVAFSTIALYNVLELVVIIFAAFKQRRGIYFYSFIVATGGIVPHTVGFILKFFSVAVVWWIPILLAGIGWFAMVSGQSFVSYSRLHLIVRDEFRIRWVLYLIIFDAIIFGVPLVILAFLTNSPSSDPTIVIAFSAFDKIQVGIFFVQESIISVIYIYETMRVLGPTGKFKQNPVGKLFLHIILVNILVLVFDATLLGTEYSGNFEIQTTYKPAIYSIKLKIEFSILNRLVDIVKNKGFAFSNPSSNTISHPIHTLPNTASSDGQSWFMENIIKDDQQPRAKTTEWVVVPTDWSGQSLGGLNI